MPHVTQRRLIFAGVAALCLAIAFGLSSTVAFRASVAGAPLTLRGDPAVSADLNRRLQSFSAGGLTFTYAQTHLTLATTSLAPSIDAAASVASARAALRHESFTDRLHRLLFGREFIATASYDQGRFASAIKAWSEQLSIPAVNAGLTFSSSGVGIRAGQVGQRLSLAETVERLDSSLGHLRRGSVALPLHTLDPLVTSADLESIRPQLTRWVAGPVRFESSQGEELATLQPQEILDLISLEGTAADLGVRRPPTDVSELAARSLVGAASGGRLQSGLDASAVDSYVKTLAIHIERPAQNVTLASQPGPVQIASPSQPGLGVDRTELLKRFRKALEAAVGERTVTVPTKSVPADVREDNLAALGIIEQVSEGTSSFGASPANRIHNIKTGVSKFSSVLVKPDETFSFNAVLGDVDSSTGYLPELVILVDKTVPQFGGGLCQVSSTAWRGSLDLGLPTLSRTNHSYPVSYYFPLGTDATIYLPYPDMRWKNTTGHSLLIQARVVGSNVYFTYFGTNPGWTVQFSRSPDFASVVSRAESLPPYSFNDKPDGSKDTIFYRRITDAAGHVVLADKYFSHYDSPDKFPHTTQN